MRTTEQILAHIEEVRRKDFFGATTGDLVCALPFEAAKPYLKNTAKAVEWKVESNPKEAILNYLPFAWSKANARRGLSASRSIDHFRAWLWLLGMDDPDTPLDALYEFYGKPSLIYVSELLGFDWRKHDDARWGNTDNGESISDAEREAKVLAASSRALADRVTYQDLLLT